MLDRTAKPIRRARKRQSLFACLPQPVLKHPPIVHRGQPADGLLEVFEVAIAAAVLKLAWQAMADARHLAGLKQGKTTIRKERADIGRSSAQDTREYNARKIPNGFTGKKTPWGFYMAGSAGYKEGREGFVPPAVLRIEATPTGLLRAARMSENSRNINRVAAALDRLCEPVQVGADELPALIRTRERLDNTRVRLTLEPAWMPSVIGRVPLPLPTRGNCRVVLALYLFLAGADQRTSVKTTMLLEALCDLVGIRETRYSHRRRTLDKALNIINEHLADLFDEDELATAKLPIRFDMNERGDRVHFKAIFKPPVQKKENDPIVAMMKETERVLKAVKHGDPLEDVEVEYERAEVDIDHEDEQEQQEYEREYERRRAMRGEQAKGLKVPPRRPVFEA